jgi:hypothetical protein
MKTLIFVFALILGPAFAQDISACKSEIGGVCRLVPKHETDKIILCLSFNASDLSAGCLSRIEKITSEREQHFKRSQNFVDTVDTAFDPRKDLRERLKKRREELSTQDQIMQQIKVSELNAQETEELRLKVIKLLDEARQKKKK